MDGPLAAVRFRGRRFAAERLSIGNPTGTAGSSLQRIVRILIEEIIADVDDSASEIVLLIHWTGRSPLRASYEEKPHRHAQPLHESGND